MPYFLYFLVTLGITIYAYIIPEPSGLGSVPRYIATFFYWGLFIVSFVSYYVTRKVFIKKEGFKYTLFVFLFNPYIIYSIYVIDEEFFYYAVINLFTFYIFFMLMYITYLLTRKH